jgi:hypothetical protein
MGSKAESITETMVTRNSYDVDAVSGATLSSEAIKSAVSKALKKAAGNEYAMRQASGCVMIMVFSQGMQEAASPLQGETQRNRQWSGLAPTTGVMSFITCRG